MNRRAIVATSLLGGGLLAGLLAAPHVSPADAPGAEEAAREATPAEPSPDAPPPGALSRVGTLRLKSVGRATCVDLSADGTLVAAAGDDGFVRIWSTADGREVRRLERGHGPDNDTIQNLAISPDKKRIAFSGGSDPFLHVCDLFSGKEVQSFGIPQVKGGGPIFAFSPDGKSLAWWGASRIRLSEAASGKQIWDRRGIVPSTQTRILFSPDGKTLAILGGPTMLIDAGSGKDLFALPSGPRDFYAAAFSPDGRMLATATDTEILTWDVATGRECRPRLATGRVILWLAFTDHGKELAATDMNGGGDVWDLAAGKVSRHFVAAEKQGARRTGASQMVFSADGAKAAWVPWGVRVHLTDIASGDELLPPSDDDPWPDGFAFTPDGAGLAATAVDGNLRLWDATTGKVRRRFEGPGGSVHFVGFPSDGKSLISIGDQVIAWDVATGKVIQRYAKVPGASNQTVAISQDGKTVAYGQTNVGRVWPPPRCAVHWWDLETGKRTESAGSHVGPILSIAFSPDGRTLASVGEDGTLLLSDAASGAKLWQIAFLKISPAYRVAFGSDGKTVVTAHVPSEPPGSAASVVLWDAANGKELHRFKAAASNFLALFSADGERVALDGPDGAIDIWDVAEGRRMVRGTLGGGWPMTALSPDGRRLASWWADGTFVIWDVGRPPSPVRP